MQRQVGHTRPGDHQIARFLDPRDLLEVENPEQVFEVFKGRKLLVRRGALFFYPMLVVGFGVLRHPGVGVARGGFRFGVPLGYLHSQVFGGLVARDLGELLAHLRVRLPGIEPGTPIDELRDGANLH